MALLAEYGFNEGSGLVAADSSGNGRNLAASNTSTSWTTSGRFLGAALSQHTGLPGTNTSLTDWTMMAWVKRTGTWTAWACAFGKNGVLVEFNAASSYVANFFGGTNSNALGPALALDTWTHYAVTRTAAGSIFWVNGVATGAAIANAAQNFGTGTWGVALTAATSGDDSTFVGPVDDFRTFDAALTGPEIISWANTPIPKATGVLLQENGHPLLLESGGLLLL